MTNTNDILPKIFIYVGALLLIVGVVLLISKGRLGLDWFGHLPGDFSIERDNFRFYAPIASMLIVSLAINILIRIYRYFF
jgi:Protein of unknown function (DUF2905)